MSLHKTITVNGRLYDAVTGLPIDTLAPSDAKPKSPPKAASPANIVKPPVAKTTPKKAMPMTPRSTTVAENVHSSVQRSQTLNRRAAKKPAPTNRPITRRPTVGRQMDIAKNTNVARFAKNPAAATATATAVKPLTLAVPQTKKATPADKPAQSHPMVGRALSRTKKKVPAPVAKPATAKEVKDEAIKKALAAPKPKATKVAKANKKKLGTLIIIGAIVLVVVTALVAAYRFFPGISVGIASAQAGISATYPEFTPDGYALSQPVTYSDGEVALKFHSNSNDNYYTVTQTRSSWDSSAVLDKVVAPEAGADYVTTKERGLTIYTYDSVAAWVNGGLLYKIDSKAPLSGDQIRRIATSL